MRCGLPRSHVDLPGTKVLVAACLQKMRLAVAEVKPLRPAIALCRMPSRASASTTCLRPMGLDGELLEQSVRIEKKACNCWFELTTVWRQIWRNDHHGSGLQQCHVALTSSKGKLGFRWEAVTGRFNANFGPLEAQKSDPYRSYCLKWGGVTFSPRV